MGPSGSNLSSYYNFLDDFAIQHVTKNCPVCFTFSNVCKEVSGKICSPLFYSQCTCMDLLAMHHDAAAAQGLL